MQLVLLDWTVIAIYGMVWLLRWYWWRVNAWAEISAMAGSFFVANGFVWAGLAEKMGWLSGAALEAVSTFYSSDYDMVRAVFILLSCTATWVAVALATRPDPEEKLEAFYRRVRPGGWWGPIARRCPGVEADVPASRRWRGWFLGVLFIWSSLLGVGYLCTGRPWTGLALLVLAAAGAFGTLKVARLGEAER